VSEAIAAGRATGGGEITATLAHSAATGTAREYRIRTTPMRDDGGVVLGSVTLLEDITPVSCRERTCESELGDA